MEEKLSSEEKANEIPEKDRTFVRCAVTKFFTENPNPDDDDFHTFADKMKISPHELEEVAYELLGALLKGVGKHKEVPVTEFDPKEIKMGIEVEKEHTDSEAIAQQIAKDHLIEIPDYYTRLAKMEEEGKKALRKKD
jgi:hypothetical protein